MSAELADVAKPRAKKKPAAPEPSGERPNTEAAVRKLADDPAAAAVVVAAAIDEIRASVDVLCESVMQKLARIDDDLRAVGMVVSDKSRTGDAKVLDVMKQTATRAGQLADRAEWIIETFGAFSRLNSEADKSTQIRFRTMLRVLERYTAKHDKKQSAKRSLTGPQIACLATGGFLAIIGLIATIGWVLG